MEWLSRVLGEATEEKLKEGMDILASNWTSADSFAAVSVGIPNINGLIQEYDICIRVPTERVMSCVVPVVSDAARSKFEQQSRR
jgi:hypothetical protein